MSKYINIFIIIFIFIVIRYRISFIFDNSKDSLFYRIFDESKRRLIYSFKTFSKCIKYSSLLKCMKQNNEIYKFKKVLHENNLSSFNDLDKYNILIYPYINKKSKNIVIIPVAPTELITRIAIRSTWYKKNRNLCYFFYMGKPEKKNNSYSLSFLYEEAKRYNDILLFDIENSYVKCILLLLLCYRYIINNFHNLEFLVRVNSDMLFLPYRLYKLLQLNEEVIGYETEQIGIKYLSGCFYVLKKKYIEIALNEAKTTIPVVFYDDIYFGQINRKIKFKNIAYINNYDYYLPVYDYNQNLIFNKSRFLISAHSINSDALLYFWKYFGNSIIYN